MKYIFLAIGLSILFIGCGSVTHTEKLNLKVSDVDIKKYEDSKNLNDIIINIADQLLQHNKNLNNTKKIVLTTFVDLESFTTTNPLGRIISESLYNELHSRNYEIVDFRGQNTVSVNDEGEFHLTRDVNKLKDEINAVEVVLVGTYSRFENESILINSRLIDSISGFVYSTARIIYKPYNCKEYNICNETEYNRVAKEKESINIVSPSPIQIISDTE